MASVGHADVQLARDVILTLPLPWVLERVEAAAEPLLREGAGEEYRRLLELYRLLDRGLMTRLATRSAQHTDADAREAGADFLDLETE